MDSCILDRIFRTFEALPKSTEKAIAVMAEDLVSLLDPVSRRAIIEMAPVFGEIFPELLEAAPTQTEASAEKEKGLHAAQVFRVRYPGAHPSVMKHAVKAHAAHDDAMSGSSMLAGTPPGKIADRSIAAHATINKHAAEIAKHAEKTGHPDDQALLNYVQGMGAEHQKRAMQYRELHNKMAATPRPKRDMMKAPESPLRGHGGDYGSFAREDKELSLETQLKEAVRLYPKALRNAITTAFVTASIVEDANKESVVNARKGFEAAARLAESAGKHVLASALTACAADYKG